MVKTRNNISMRIPVKNTLSYVQIFNGIFKLTHMEMMILSLFIDDMDQHPDDAPLSASSKKRVADELGWTNFNTLNNYVKKLKEKSAIKKKASGYQIHPFLIPGAEKIEIHIDAR